MGQNKKVLLYQKSRVYHKTTGISLVKTGLNLSFNKTNKNQLMGHKSMTKQTRLSLVSKVLLLCFYCATIYH